MVWIAFCRSLWLRGSDVVRNAGADQHGRGAVIHLFFALRVCFAILSYLYAAKDVWTLLCIVLSVDLFGVTRCDYQVIPLALSPDINSLNINSYYLAAFTCHSFNLFVIHSLAFAIASATPLPLPRWPSVSSARSLAWTLTRTILSPVSPYALVLGLIFGLGVSLGVLTPFPFPS